MTRVRVHSPLLPPPPDLACCTHCRHVAWLIWAGQGLRCRHPANRSNPDLKHIGFAPLVPSRYYVCGLVERQSSSKNGPTS